MTCHASYIIEVWQYMILGLQKIMKKKNYWLNIYNIAETIGKLLEEMTTQVTDILIKSMPYAIQKLYILSLIGKVYFMFCKPTW